MITLRFCNNEDDLFEVEVEPIEVHNGYALHRTVLWNGIELDTYTVTHINSGFASGSPLDTFEEARRILTILADIKINDVGIGDLSARELISALPEISKLVQKRLGIKQHKEVVLENQRRLRNTLKL